MYLKKVSSMQIGQYGYDSDLMRHFVCCGYSRVSNSYKMYDVINECYFFMDGDVLLSVING